MLSTAGAVAVEALDPSDVDAGVAAHYGDPMREQRLLATAVGLVDRSNRGVIAVPGADRLGWLHSVTTQYLEQLPPMTGTELLVLSPHGHVEHHAVTLDDGTTTFLDVEPNAKDSASGPLGGPTDRIQGDAKDSASGPSDGPSDRIQGGTAEGLLEFLTRMRFLMRVDPADVTAEWAVLSLVGPDAPAAAESLGAGHLDPPEIAAVPAAKFAAGSVPAASSSRYQVAPLSGGGFARRMSYGVDLLVPRSAVDTIVSTVDVPLAGLWAFEALRVGDRRPRLGRETDHRTLPAEVGWLAGAVHLDKGCYRGQETVARVHNLGRPPRKLVLLHLDGISTDDLPAPGTAVSGPDGRAVGVVGTAVRHFELGMVALALVKQNVRDDAALTVGASAAAIDPT